MIREHLMLPLVATVIFISGLTIDPRNALKQLRNARALSLTLLSTFVIAPLTAYGLAQAFAPPESNVERLFVEAMMIVGSQASTLATAIVLTRIARGDVELSLLSAVLSNGLTCFATPVILRLALESDVSFPVTEMVGKLGLAVLLPLVLGGLARRLVWSPSPRAIGPLMVMPQLIVLTFMYTACSSAAEHLAANGALVLRFLGACTGLHALMLCWTILAPRALGLPLSERRAIVFSASQKTVPNGMYLWSTFFATNPFGAVPLVLHQLVQLILGNLLAVWLARRSSTAT